MAARWAALLIGIALLGGLVALQAVRPQGGAPAPANAPGTEPTADLQHLRSAVAALEADLARARERNQAMEEEIEWLREEVRDLADERTAIAEAEAEAEPAEGAAPEQALLDEAALLAAGLDPRELEEIRARIDAIALDRLYLRDAADREGWRGTRRWRRERRALDEEWRGIREEFGDELYDWGMYASGRANRVVAADVLRGSAADQAGVLPGDVIVSYGDRRVFQTRDLREGTRAGRAGAQTELIVQRNGQRLRFFVPRGPLGITPEPVVGQPMSR